MKTKLQPPAVPTPVSIRINAETRALLDFLIERTGLKDAQIFRLGVKRLAEREQQAQSAAAPKAKRKTR